MAEIEYLLFVGSTVQSITEFIVESIVGSLFQSIAWFRVQSGLESSPV